ncbi:uncharacterized protein E0L32_004874 [Thyridium curvatum]|uniref:SNF7 family protein n=1 Tax=Thyridium curvatum TaxID=1093900 RepID=A0A507B8W0_9PEZI|nr:uncharacterized protein E0L32_004874 [Thyridium curvatum]TPX15044.1 hypothetical protein E0L32_004874 [Thyridium curvatum]
MGDLVDFLTQNEEGFRKARLPALYSDFRGLRTINPDGYAANVSAWRRALASIARSGRAPSRASAPSLFILPADEQLLRALESKQYGRPLALGSVVREAALEKDLIPLQDFLKAKESIYQRSWTSLPWNVVSWGLRQLGLTGGVSGGDDKLPGGQFVVLANVEEASRAFDDKTAEYSSRLQRTWSATHFKKSFADSIFSSQRLSDADMDVFLKFLSRDKGLILYDGKTIKVKAAGDEQMAITPEDEAMAQLKELTAYLSHQTSILNRRIEELTATAKEAVVRKNKVAALAALKSKKIAESSLQTRFATLSQLEEVAAKIEHAADNVALVRVMSSSTDVLKSLNAQVGGADKVEDVVDRLREQMGAVDEVGSILAESGSVVDEGEIDDELEVLEKEERQKEEEARKSKEEAEKARREAEQAKEAEETRKRLEAVEAPKSIPQQQQTSEMSTAAAADNVEGLSRLSLEETRQMEPAS